MELEVEKYVKQYGEERRPLITSALKWLEAEEPTWGLVVPINKDEFIFGLIEKSKPSRG